MVTSQQQVARLYEIFSDAELTFNAHVMAASGLIPSEVYIRIGEEHVLCVLYASSMKRARVVAEMDSKVLGALSRAGNMLSLRLAFKVPGESAPVSFFVSAHADGFSEYNQLKPQLKFVTLSFPQRPPDPLVTALGMMLQLKADATQRKDQRIVLTPESMERIGLHSRDSCVAIDGAFRRCILRDLSFSGAKVLTTAEGSVRGPEKVQLKLVRCEVKDDTVLEGTVARVEDVQGRPDLIALSIRYTAEPPVAYTQKLNGYFGAGR